VIGLKLRIFMAVGMAAATSPSPCAGQPNEPGSLGDKMIRAYLARETANIESRLAADLSSREAWESRRPKYLEQYYYMLGLSPMPERTPLHATVTRTISRDDYVVDMLHFQSRPRLYVTGNLYRPAKVKPGERLPAVLYVCGHADHGRDGNKTGYKSHGVWFARHGYVCLMIDTLQLGEIAAYHHGTYKLGRWWWHSRGYTPAGVEAWNGMRAIDYLTSRPDVDPERIAVTGISGGGAATFWIVAADERVKVAVPVSGMSDLQSYVADHIIDGHCDCMFLYNTYQWPWTRIAALIAPRPMLFVNSDQDSIFPMPANERIANRLESVYRLFGAGDQFDAVVSVGGHDYRQDINQAVYRFINMHLKDDSRRVLDSEVEEGALIEDADLRVFPTDADLPTDELNTNIDEHFVPAAHAPAPESGKFDVWRRDLLAQLREHCFIHFPETIPAAKRLKAVGDHELSMESEEGVDFRLRFAKDSPERTKKTLLVVLNQDEAGAEPQWVSRVVKLDERVVYCEPRGVGATRWTTKNPPNYVERAHALLGRTVDAGRVWDIIAAARFLSKVDEAANGAPLEVRVAGRGSAGVIAAYAAALDQLIAGAVLVAPPLTHMDDAAPQFLNILRICDIPDALGLIAPRPLCVLDATEEELARAAAAYDAAGALRELQFK
jgi:cephalosporin-C deacetylase-like acetyl esterase